MMAARITNALRMRTMSGLGFQLPISDAFLVVIQSSSGQTPHAGAWRPQCGLVWPAAEPADARRVLGQRRLEVVGTEVRPQRLGDDDLRVSALPEQEVAHAMLAGSADDKVRVGKAGLVH